LPPVGLSELEQTGGKDRRRYQHGTGVLSCCIVAFGMREENCYVRE
jgi:hypothetical protein